MMTRQLPIIAIATAPGKAGIGVVRISGKNLGAIIQALFEQTLQPRQANLRTLRDSDGQTIDQLIAIYFSAPASFTGEDVLELQCHGGPQLLELVMRRCLELGKNEGLVIAEPGEFSLRAYLNNKIDLAQAEAIAEIMGFELTKEFEVEVTVLYSVTVNARNEEQATNAIHDIDFDTVDYNSDSIQYLSSSIDRVDI